MKYDDASWHYEGDYPAGLPEENGATHIGMFLAFMIENDLVSSALRVDAAREIALVKKRKMTGASFLMKVCDEKLTDEDLSAEGNRFAAAYFMKKYIDDYAGVFGDDAESLYELADTWKNYDRFRPILEDRFAAFVAKAKKVKSRSPSARSGSAAGTKTKAKTKAKPPKKRTSRPRSK
jgi:hypothetical protein